MIGRLPQESHPVWGTASSQLQSTGYSALSTKDGGMSSEQCSSFEGDTAFKCDIC
jgi:hypothetical protein